MSCRHQRYNPAWAGQEAVAFPDNWTIGLSFYHNVFAREHNLFVDTFRARAAQSPNADSGLRDPANPDSVITYKDVIEDQDLDELYEAARLVVSAEIAKIHTIEWTTQLLYDEVLYEGMNANWHGLLKGGDNLMSRALSKIVAATQKSADGAIANLGFSIFVSGSGIIGTGNKVYANLAAVRSGEDSWDMSNADHVNALPATQPRNSSGRLVFVWCHRRATPRRFTFLLQVSPTRNAPGYFRGTQSISANR